MSLTGVGASLTCSNSAVKFTSALYNVSRISGLARSVEVIDDSHLGITAGLPKQYCFGDLHNLSPITVDCHIDPDNTTIFPNGDKADGSVPLPIGTASGTTTNDVFVLTLPTDGTASDLEFSGAVVSDSGIELVNNDRLRVTYQVQPDGKTFNWNGDGT